MIDPTNEKTTAREESDASAPKATRARLTVEVPTEITAGMQPEGGTHCYCSRTYCCNLD